jgi:transposase, IS30 family
MRYCQLTEGERYTISGLLRAGLSNRAIAHQMGRHPTTVGRERRRNATTHDGAYRAEKAQQYAVARRRRCRRGSHYSERQWAFVDSLVRRRWSPQQISRRLGQRGQLRISTETIYRRLRRDKAASGTVWKHLRVMSKRGRKRRNSPNTRGRLLGKKHISQRPEQAQARHEIGHWEGDTVMGSDQRHCVLTMVERATGYVQIKKLSARTKEQATAAMKRAIADMRRWFKTITLDNGTEFHGYEEVERKSKVQIYFATPYHSWERGTNENTNGLIRQYIPKGTDLKTLTQAECNWIANELNTRPRKRLNYQTPAEVLSQSGQGVALGR